MTSYAELSSVSIDSEDTQNGNKHLTSVKLIAGSGLDKLPSDYVLSPSERPSADNLMAEARMPVIDVSALEGPQRTELIQTIGHACAEWGCFQIINHGIPTALWSNMMSVASEFFNLPLDEKMPYFSTDVTRPVRYGTSINQLKDRVLCWRDFLKHYCYPVSETCRLWPTNPPDYRAVTARYSEQTRLLVMRLIAAICESLGLSNEYVRTTFGEGSLTMVLNCYPPCPEPDLTFGIAPHTDFGCITILLQDDVAGLQVSHEGQWLTVPPLPNSFVINVGDLMEVLSNGRCKSVEHRSLVNSERTRLSIATIYSLPFEAKVSPAKDLIDEAHPRMYRDTNFQEYLQVYDRNRAHKGESFLNSLRLP